MTKRTKRIQTAFDMVDARDMKLCLVCRKPKKPGGMELDHAHIFPRNNIVGKADDPHSIMTLCRNHHAEYDRNKTHLRRIRWLMRNGLTQFAQYAIMQIRIYKATKIVTRNVNKIVDSEIKTV